MTEDDMADETVEKIEPPEDIYGVAGDEVVRRLSQRLGAAETNVIITEAQSEKAKKLHAEEAMRARELEGTIRAHEAEMERLRGLLAANGIDPATGGVLEGVPMPKPQVEKAA